MGTDTLRHSITVTIVTSRLRRLVVPDELWLAGLLGVLRKIATDHVRLVVGDGTAGADFVLHIAKRLGIACEQISTAEELVDDENAVPQRDRVVVDAADIVYVLTLRSGGNIHRLLRERLQQRRGQVVLIDVQGLQSELSRRELLELGAITWQPSPDECRPINHLLTHEDARTEDAAQANNEVYLIVPFPHHECWDFLTHTTRSCPGPWPDESFESYADSLIESNSEADHSPLGSLKRIVRQKRLIASSRTIRGGYRVVSLTACPLDFLPGLHTFRPHRTRWDFEPYGICIRREWLIGRGARPVNYNEESGWQALSEDERPFFQIGRGDSGVDWSIEREWRHLGDLDLSGLTAENVLLFVPDFESAKSLAAATTWPVTLWPVSVEPAK